jgi:hypothetical protein
MIVDNDSDILMMFGRGGKGACLRAPRKVRARECLQAWARRQYLRATGFEKLRVGFDGPFVDVRTKDEDTCTRREAAL